MNPIDLSNPLDLFWYPYRNHFTKNEDGKLTGINLCGQGLDDHQVEKILQEDLSELRVLNLSENKLSNFIIPSSCKQLELLNLCENIDLKTIDFQGRAYKKLKVLDVNECGVDSFSLPEGFESLQTIDFRKNHLTHFELLGDCPELSQLDLSENQLGKLQLPRGLQKLTYLYLNDNVLQRLEWAVPLKKLKTLHLRNNKLTELSRNLLQFDSLETLYLYGNPFDSLPPGILPQDERENSFEKIRDYLREAGKGTVINDRVKIIIVGNGRVGKTSMYKRLVNESFDNFEPFTHGVQLGFISKNHLPKVRTPSLNANVWDFGGQEIFYATHQFFLSGDALYLLAWTDEENVKAHRERDKGKLPFDEKWRSREYWLENIRLHGKDSPIIMVQTHIDKLKTSINELEYESYKVECLGFSASEDFGLKELKDCVSKQINHSLPFYGEEFPATYDQVIEAIEQKKNESNYISLTEFHSICKGQGISDGAENSVLDYLVKTGLVVYFKTPKLKETIYINPNWLTEQVYLLINNKLRSRKGRIDLGYLKEIFPGKSDFQHQQFIELLQKFELIFQESEEKGIYIAPQYLPPELSEEAADLLAIIQEDLEDTLFFRLPKFFPENVMINFLSRYGPYSRKLYWESGICFSKETKTKCIVTYNEEEKCLCVHTQAHDRGRTLQREVLNALQELSNEAYSEVSLDGKAFVSWEALQKSHDSEIDKLWDVSGKSPITVADFRSLFGIEEKLDRGFELVSEDEYEQVAPSYTGNLVQDTQEVLRFEGIKEILFLAANPSDQSQIKTNPEHRKIKAELEQGQHRDQFTFLDSEFALTGKSMLRAFARNKPHIIHFAGHGNQEGIFIAKENNQHQKVSTDALSMIFRPLEGTAKVIILNSCYSAKQAQELSKIKAYVVGNKLPVNDDAAIAFSVGFYLGLGEGKDFFGALYDGIALLMIEHGHDKNVIEVWKDGEKIGI